MFPAFILAAKMLSCDCLSQFRCSDRYHKSCVHREKDADMPLMFLRYLAETFCFGVSLHVSDGTGTSVVPELHEK